MNVHVTMSNLLATCSIRHSHVLWDSRRLTGLVAMVAVSELTSCETLQKPRCPTNELSHAKAICRSNIPGCEALIFAIKQKMGETFQFRISEKGSCTPDGPFR